MTPTQRSPRKNLETPTVHELKLPILSLPSPKKTCFFFPGTLKSIKIHTSWGCGNLGDLVGIYFRMFLVPKRRIYRKQKKNMWGNKLQNSWIPPWNHCWFMWIYQKRRYHNPLNNKSCNQILCMKSQKPLGFLFFVVQFWFCWGNAFTNSNIHVGVSKNKKNIYIHWNIHIHISK